MKMRVDVVEVESDDQGSIGAIGYSLKMAINESCERIEQQGGRVLSITTQSVRIDKDGSRESWSSNGLVSVIAYETR